MIQVAEVIYVVPSVKEDYLKKLTNPSIEAQRVAWTYGIRNRCIYTLGDMILETFDYVGKNFYKDMRAYGAHPLIAPDLVSRRRRDVPVTELGITNWWAPVKVAGRTLTESPMPDDEEEEDSMEEMYRAMVNGHMMKATSDADVSYDEDDWSESLHF